MNKYQDLDLIEAKIEFVAGYIKEEKYIANLKLMFIPLVEDLRKKQKQPTGAITRLNKTFDSMVTRFLPLGVRAALEARLLQEFGASDLKALRTMKKEDKIINGILTRNRIKTAHEAELVSAFLGNVTNETRIGHADYLKLGGIFDSYRK